MRRAHVLAILGDTEHFGDIVDWIRRRGLGVDIAITGEHGLAAQQKQAADLVLVGLPLPDMRAAQIIGGVRLADPRVPIVVVGTDGDIGSQLEALELGAQEYVAHPVEGRKDLLFALGVSLGVRKTDAHFRVLRAREAAAADWRRIIGGCEPMATVMLRLRAVCERTLSGAAPTVLLVGEMGTGKRLIARALHYNGARHNRAFGEVNCASLTPDELRATLFGSHNHLGLLETTDGGTLFVDEVGAAPLDVQQDLLLAIEDRMIRRRGAEPIRIDVQLVAATRRDLYSMTKRDEFRADLYHRLNVLAVELPPLRERGDDIAAIARQLVADIALEHGVPAPALSDEAAAALAQRAWPGNIRELRNEMERVVLLVDDDTVRPEHLRGATDATKVAIDADLTVTISGDKCPLEQLEREVIKHALVRSHGNVSRAARFLAITRQTLLYRMKKYDLRGSSGQIEAVEENDVQ